MICGPPPEKLAKFPTTSSTKNKPILAQSLETWLHKKTFEPAGCQTSVAFSLRTPKETSSAEFSPSNSSSLSLIIASRTTSGRLLASFQRNGCNKDAILP
ncbi:hypothetical protein FRC03_005142 [Tulasnella sp. 419]|nr:hypothetical protein FRC03_005142 [Tulasnella sp. 419]